ncbi:MAG: ABC-2 transporter permease [Firmicutes bacterium]|nr:ABC-2 transporter permease [Bacillota bacterium]
MLQTTVVYEDMNKSELIINSLPIKKEKIILARYLSIFVYLAISIISYFLISFLIGVVHLPFAVELVTILGIVTIILGIAILISIYLPVFYKYGYIKAKLFHILFMMIAFFLPTTIINIFKDNPDVAFVKYINSII